MRDNYLRILRTVFIYALFGGLWIIISDKILEILFQDPQTLTLLQTYKGWFYIFVTALLLAALIWGNIREIEEKNTQVSDAQLTAIYSLAKLAQSRDDEMGRHVERVQTYCQALAQGAAAKGGFDQKIDQTFVDDIYTATALHDIGKVGIQDSILLKPGKLTPEEFEMMKTHTLIGYNTLVQAREKDLENGFLDMGLEITRSHHECWDGTGYPDGLAGDEIPLSARIMAVADVYDALRSKRVYKEPFDHQKSVEIIKEQSGSHFDPRLVDLFLEMNDVFASIYREIQE